MDSQFGLFVRAYRKKRLRAVIWRLGRPTRVDPLLLFLVPIVVKWNRLGTSGVAVGARQRQRSRTALAQGTRAGNNTGERYSIAAAKDEAPVVGHVSNNAAGGSRIANLERPPIDRGDPETGQKITLVKQVISPQPVYPFPNVSFS
jgi:hypothetical protein